MTQQQILPGQVLGGVGGPGGGGDVDELTTPGDLLVYSAGEGETLELSNATPSGNEAVGGAVEQVVSDMDLDLSAVGDEVNVVWNFYWSMNHGSVPKDIRIRLRRDGLGGEVLAEIVQSATIDNAGGHNINWSSSYTDEAPTTGHYVMTTQPEPGSSSSTIYSDTRVFEVSTIIGVTPGPVRLPVSGVNGRVLIEDDAEPEGMRWGDVGASGGSGGWPDSNVDSLPSAPHSSNDEMNDAASISLWTPTPSAADVFDIDTTAPDRMYIKGPVNNGALRGGYKAVPAFPFAVGAKLAAHTALSGSSRVGIFIGPATPVNGTVVHHLSWVKNSNGVQRVAQQLGGSYVGASGVAALSSQPLYLQIRVIDADTVSYLASVDGLSWTTIENVDPGFTPAIFGCYASSESTSGLYVEAQFEWVRFKSLA